MPGEGLIQLELIRASTTLAYQESPKPPEPAPMETPLPPPRPPPEPALTPPTPPTPGWGWVGTTSELGGTFFASSLAAFFAAGGFFSRAVSGSAIASFLATSGAFCSTTRAGGCGTIEGFTMP